MFTVPDLPFLQSLTYTLESITGIIGNSSILLCDVLGLRGQCLNAYPDVIRDPSMLDKCTQDLSRNASRGIGSHSPRFPRVIKQIAFPDPDNVT
jgi:hypothetical protein